MIHFSNIEFSYPASDFHLRISDLKIDSASKTAVIGPSGFGKTTLLNLLAGILLPQGGDVLYEGKTINRLGEKERRDFRITHIGFVFQDFRLIPYLNVMDNILLPFRINGILKMDNSSMDHAHSLAGELGIADKLKKYPDKLSQGERQRVAICRALINKPPIILADEPTGNLDPKNKKRIMKILFDNVDKHNTTLIAVTHDHEMLQGFSRVIDFNNLQQEK